jgi:hypothetical protein
MMKTKMAKVLLQGVTLQEEQQGQQGQQEEQAVPAVAVQTPPLLLLQAEPTQAACSASLLVLPLYLLDRRRS